MILILPDRHIQREPSFFLQAFPEREWRTPSHALPRDEFGNEVKRTRFYVAAKLHDGHVIWRGWFESFEDWDQFCFSLALDTLRWDRALWDLPTPHFEPDLIDHPGVSWIYAATASITSTSASNQTESAPSTWNRNNNFVDCIASGGSGGAANYGGGGPAGASGGGGGAWSRFTNVPVSPGDTVTFRLSAGGAAVGPVGFGTNTAGNAGADCWYNATSLAGVSGIGPGAKGGAAGQVAATGVAAASAAGGASGSGFGSSKNSGGASGTATANSVLAASGGGGAAGPSGGGGASSNVTDTASSGGTGNGGGVSGGSGNTAGNGNAGSAGTHYGSVGAGGGGGGGQDGSGGAATGGQGGLYGAGGGAASNLNTGGCASGQGRQALIWKNWVPASHAYRHRTRFFTRRF